MSTARAILFIFAGAIASAIATSTPAQDRLTGVWLTEDGSTRVSFQPCGAVDCGQIVWLHEPNDPETSRPWRDKFNADEALKSRPLNGLTMLLKLEPQGAQVWTGTLYNPVDGNSYAGRIRMLDPTKLQLEGCAFAGLLCQSETWVRVK